MRYPYAVSLSYGGHHFCGGALIAPDVVITAGHCHSANSLHGITGYDVVVGRHDLRESSSSSSSGGGGGSIRVDSEVLHPDYDGDDVDNDFNIVILSESASSLVSGMVYPRVNDDDAVPVGGYLPEEGGIMEEGENDDDDDDGGDDVVVDVVGDALTVVGWGDTDDTDNEVVASDVLMETTVYAMTNEMCVEDSGGYVNSGGGTIVYKRYDGITDNMMCARAVDTDACQVSSVRYIYSDGWREEKKKNTHTHTLSHIMIYIFWEICSVSLMISCYSSPPLLLFLLLLLLLEIVVRSFNSSGMPRFCVVGITYNEHRAIPEVR
jgi:trypsin